MTLTRHKDWRRRYEAAIDEIKARPFVWGEHDCGPSLAGRLVHAMTGVDLSAQYAGTYHDALSAARLIRELGFETLGDLVASMLPPIHPSQAEIGDIAAIAMDGPIGHALGVVNGERIFVLTETGVGTVDLLDAAICFKVG
ncbi:hypothetical protein RHAB21_00727 [Pseudorhizobium halotolerans]|uniref:DUF6950 domain-containing protein n=1 Tax=Pseudorhizobium halotolerans TaxID=1233081 RepID=A0ABM8PYY4_9HYPH|nr:hypothetical protein [Pseudorhizobium halotolerans]CAD7055487.1 hypothetical protein RHAB21_00727 [Pseudorhizobium halotolerans]